MSKKYRITNKFRFITSLTILMLIAAFSFSAILGTNAVAGNDVREYITVKVSSGDTLWDLAKEYGPANVDCRKLVYEIQQINNVSAESLQAGQTIQIPANSL